MPRFFPAFTATTLHVTTYFLGIALFSIAFLVFLNSSISFVVTQVIGQEHDVGDAVGTLGFADELLALVACPLWGLVSDRVGVRPVATVGYCLIGVSLFCLVQSTNVYPQLLLGRLGFSLGGAACSTMVTACLPSMVAPRHQTADDGAASAIEHAAGTTSQSTKPRRDCNQRYTGHAPASSVSSDATITPQRWTPSPPTSSTGGDHDSDKLENSSSDAETSQLAGFVGIFTGLGALLALALFLPLPAFLEHKSQTKAQGVQFSFYIVGSVALFVATFVFTGLRNLPGEEAKSIRSLFNPSHGTANKRNHEVHTEITETQKAPSYLMLISRSVTLGFTDPAICLGYLGGFVARASSVGVSLFIPLFVNDYFIRNGLCSSSPKTPEDIRENCNRAYKLAAALTGVAETAALICAPIFGWLGGRIVRGRSEWPLLGASVVGVIGNGMFGLLKNPDAFHGHGGQWSFVAVTLIGMSQIGTIVCSLGLLGRGINQSADHERGTETPGTFPRVVCENEEAEDSERDPLLPTSHSRPLQHRGRTQLKGSIAGVYSLAGGAAILLLTKLGGLLFDRLGPGAPFYMLAIFNACLLIAIILINGVGPSSRVLGRKK